MLFLIRFANFGMMLFFAFMVVAGPLKRARLQSVFLAFDF